MKATHLVKPSWDGAFACRISTRSLAASLFILTLVLVGRPAVGAVTHSSADAQNESRVDALMRSMTTVEAIDLIGGNGFETNPLSRLGIPAIRMTDGPLGVRWGRATAFPAPIMIGASFDPALARELARVMAIETKVRGRDMLLTPCIGLARHPFGGRNFETYGEDPFLNSRMAEAVVQGVQGEGVLASAKHFAVNDQEFDRHEIDTIVDERSLHELHLPMFRAAVQAGAWSVMASYNKLNGEWASENRWLLTDILKSFWGFRGFVVSDWWATRSGERAANAGLDLEMPNPAHFNRDLLQSIAAGRVSEEGVRDKARRLVRAIVGTGLIDRPVRAAPSTWSSSASHLALAKRAADEGLVLLKNDAQRLPLSGRERVVALIGPGAQQMRSGGGGSSAVLPTRVTTPEMAFRSRLGSGVVVQTETGAALEGDFVGIPTSDWAALPSSVRGVRAQYFPNADVLGAPLRTEIEPTVNFDWGWTSPDPSLPPDNWSARYTGVWIAPNDGTQDFVARGSDGVRVWFDGELVINSWQKQGEIRYHFSRPVKRGRAYAIRVETSKIWDTKTIGLGYASDNPSGEGFDLSIARARRLASAADAAIVFVGLSARHEGEGVDRARFGLPDGQDALVEAVLDVNPNAIIVITGGNPVAMPWIARAKSVIFAWYPGQEGAWAVADAVIGRVNPSGKLPVTFPHAWEDSPAYGAYPEDVPNSRRVTYREGLFTGYRHYDSRGVAPLFPFGHGLSFTRFEYSRVMVKALSGTPSNPRVEVSFLVRNAGDRDGAEASQAYVAPLGARAVRPEQELKAFEKTWLRAGEERLVRLELGREAFSRFDAASRAWTVDPGEYEVRIGSSSRDLRGRARVTLK